jgi:hypothetical protein
MKKFTWYQGVKCIKGQNTMRNRFLQDGKYDTIAAR